MAEEVMDVVPVNGNQLFEDGDIVLFEKEATLTFVDDAHVDSGTAFEGLGSDAKSGKNYRLAYLRIEMMQSEDFADGSSPTAGVRRLNVGFNLPGKTDHPTATKQKYPVNVIVGTNLLSFAGSPGNSYKFRGRFKLNDDFRAVVFNSGNLVNVQIQTESATGAGADSADDVGGLLVKVTGMLVARGSKAYKRFFPRG